MDLFDRSVGSFQIFSNSSATGCKSGRNNARSVADISATAGSMAKDCAVRRPGRRPLFIEAEHIGVFNASRRKVACKRSSMCGRRRFRLLLTFREPSRKTFEMEPYAAGPVSLD